MKPHIPLLFRKFFLGLLLVPMVVFAELPTLGDPTIKHYSKSQEIALGKAFYASLRENLNIIDDLQINDYLNTLARRLVSHSDAAGNHFKFFMVQSSAINAFAGPHGYIGINSGILLEAKNESQLAGVLAHEISHVSQRHLARMFSNSSADAITTFATVLAAALLSTRDPVAGQAALLTGLASAQQSSINFTRQNEYEADRIGIDLLAKAKLNPQGMVDFFELLLSKGDGLNIEYLRTHPLSSNRVAEAKNRLKPMHNILPNDSVDYQFCKARLEVLNTENDLSGILDTTTPETQNKDVALYKQAIRYIKADQNHEAIKLLKPLSLYNPHPWIKLALAKAFKQNNQLSLTTTTLKELVKLYPDYSPVTLAYAKNLLDVNQPQDSIAILLHQLQTDDTAIIYKNLAKAYFSNGQISAALETTGDQYVQEGYIELAIQQYEYALQQPNLISATTARLQTKKSAIKRSQAE